MDTLEWPKCNSDKATVGSVACTVYMDGQPYKLCVLCQTGFSTGSTQEDRKSSWQYWKFAE